MNFLFFINRSYHIPLFEPLWEELINRGYSKIGFFTHPSRRNGKGMYYESALEESEIKELESRGLIHHRSPKRLRPLITFMADNAYQWTEGLGFIVQIGHGTISKGLYYRNGPMAFRDNLADLICVPGSVHQRTLKKRVRKPVVATGVPKLANSKISTSASFRKFKDFDFGEHSKTILLAPTFNQEFSFLPFLPKNPRSVFGGDHKLVFKLHAMASVEERKAWRKYCDQDERAYFVVEEDISAYLEVCDLLLTDVSSVAYEFIRSVPKPVLLFDSPLQKLYWAFHEDALEFKYRDIGVRFTHFEEIPSLITLAFAKSFNKKQKQVSKLFFAQTKKGAICEVLDQSLKHHRLREKKVTLVLHQTESEFNRSLWRRIDPDRYDVILFGEKNPFGSEVRFFEGKVRLLELLKTLRQCNGLRENLIYLDTRFDVSANFFELMAVHVEGCVDSTFFSPLFWKDCLLNKTERRQFGLDVARNLAGETMKGESVFGGCFAWKSKALKSLAGRDLGLLKENRFPAKLVLDCLLTESAHNPTRPFFAEAFFRPSLFDFFFAIPEESFSKKERAIVFQKLKSLKADESSFLTGLGASYCRVQNWEKAKESLEKALALKPKFANRRGRALFHLGKVYEQLGHKTKARLCFEECVNVVPGHMKAKEALTA